jgi:hypothetical protein
MATETMGRVTFSEKKRSVLFARRLRAATIVILLSSIVVVAGHLPSGHDVAAHATEVGTAPAATADADYFSSHFAPPKGEPAEPIATF